MAASNGGMRPSWKGQFRLSLVTIPVRLYSVHTDADSVHFTTLHGVCHGKMSEKRWCHTCDCEVAYADTVKAFEVAPGQFVEVTSNELAALKVESTKTIAITAVVDADAVDPLYCEKSFYLVPDGADAAPAFAVIQAGLEGKAAIGKIVIREKELPVAVTPKGRALLVTTMRSAADVRKPEDLSELAALPEPRPEELALARQLIGTFRADVDPATFTDEYAAAVRSLVREKASGQLVAPALAESPEAARGGSLAEILAESVRAAGGTRRKSA